MVRNQTIYKFVIGLYSFSHLLPFSQKTTDRNLKCILIDCDVRCWFVTETNEISQTDINLRLKTENSPPSGRGRMPRRGWLVYTVLVNDLDAADVTTATLLLTTFSCGVQVSIVVVFIFTCLHSLFIVARTVQSTVFTRPRRFYCCCVGSSAVFARISTVCQHC